MKKCRGRGLEVVSSEDPPRYDVLKPGLDLELIHSTQIGPYCATCFETTDTGKIVAKTALQSTNLPGLELPLKTNSLTTKKI